MKSTQQHQIQSFHSISEDQRHQLLFYQFSPKDMSHNTNCLICSLNDFVDQFFLKVRVLDLSESQKMHLIIQICLDPKLGKYELCQNLNLVKHIDSRGEFHRDVVLTEQEQKSIHLVKKVEERRNLEQVEVVTWEGSETYTVQQSQEEVRQEVDFLLEPNQFKFVQSLNWKI